MKTTQHSAHLVRRLRWEEMDSGYLRKLVEDARDEDLAGRGLATPPEIPGDPSTEVLAFNGATSGDSPCGLTADGHPDRPADLPADAAAGVSARARLVARESCVVCGLRLIPLVLESYLALANAPAAAADTSPPAPSTSAHAACSFCAEDGARVEAGATLAVLEGPAGVLLRAERILLNFLQKLSGTATHAAAFAECLRGTPARLLDTRKTTPGWRVLEKYAIATGGGWNHRLGLFDRIMLKDNHLAAAAATAGERLAALVRRARAARPDLAVECEVDDIEQIPPVLDAGADVILLDNFAPPALARALALIGGRAWTEVSGGVSLETIGDIARLAPDFISTGALTHHATWADIALDWDA